MALRNTGTKPAETKPAFESMEGDDAAVEQAEQDAAVQETKAEAQAKTAATTAIATAQTRAVASPLSQATALKALQWAIPAADLEGMGIGVFPRITVGLDGFSRDKDTELGKQIKIAVLSWNPVWLVTHGEQNDAEANKLIRTSYDGVNLKNGEGTVASYIQQLKLDGYEKASVKQYIEIYCNLIEHQDGRGNPVAVPDEEQEIVQVSLSPQSVGQFQRYLLESGLRKARGIEDSNVVVLKQERKILGSNKFGIATFSAK